MSSYVVVYCCLCELCSLIMLMLAVLRADVFTDFCFDIVLTRMIWVGSEHGLHGPARAALLKISFSIKAAPADRAALPKI